MPKTIALQTHSPNLITLLQEKGYKVIDMYEASHHRETVHAYLYSTHHPDSFTAYDNFSEISDLSLGNTIQTSPITTALMLNITGLQPAQVLMTLEQRLQSPSTHSTLL